MRHFRHPLALLRYILDMTQAEFGTAIGVSESYVAALEKRDRDMSDAVLDSIAMQFGVHRTFFDCELPPVGSLQLATAVDELWRITVGWREARDLANQDSLAVLREGFIPELQVLLLSAREKGIAPMVLAKLDGWIEGILDEFGLRSKHAVKSIEYGGPSRRVRYLERKELKGPARFHSGVRWLRSSKANKAEADSAPASPEMPQHVWELIRPIAACIELNAGDPLPTRSQASAGAKTPAPEWMERWQRAALEEHFPMLEKKPKVPKAKAKGRAPVVKPDEIPKWHAKKQQLPKSAKQRKKRQ